MGVNPSKAAVMAYARRVAIAFGIPPPLFYSLIDFESNFMQFDADGDILTSRTGNIGLGQVDRDLAGPGEDPENWHDNLVIAARYFAQQRVTFGTWYAAYGAYNAGPGGWQEGSEQAQQNARVVIEAAYEVYDWTGWQGNANPNATFRPGEGGGGGGGGGGGDSGRPKVNRSFLHVDQWMERQRNGHVPIRAMTPLGVDNYNGTPAFLRPDAAAAFLAMVTAARKDGVNLLEGFGNAYRDYAWQNEIWERSNHGEEFQAAPPGESNHGLGIAVDFPTGTRQWEWMNAHSEEFGWTGDHTPGDPPHFDFRPSNNRWAYAVSWYEGTWHVETTTPKEGTPAGGRGRPDRDPHPGPDESGATEAELEAVLRGFGINPRAFDELLDQAVREQWSGAQFESAVYGSAVFRRTFPGIFRADGSLKMTPDEYNRMGDLYRSESQKFGIRVDRNRIGRWIHHNKSVEEVRADLLIRDEARNNEVFRRDFNQYLKAKGIEPLEGPKWFRFMNNRAENFYYDLYEAAYLEGPLGIKAKAARKLAGVIDAPGELATEAGLQELISRVKQVQALIAPELRAAGITRADIALIEAGRDPRGLRPTLERIIRSRSALSRVGAGAGTGGVFPALREGI